MKKKMSLTKKIFLWILTIVTTFILGLGIWIIIYDAMRANIPKLPFYEIENDIWELAFSENITVKKTYGTKGGFVRDGSIYTILDIDLETNKEVTKLFAQGRNLEFEENLSEKISFLYDYDVDQKVELLPEDTPNFEKEYMYFWKCKSLTKIYFIDDLEAITEHGLDYLFVFAYVEEPNILYFLEFFL